LTIEFFSNYETIENDRPTNVLGIHRMNLQKMAPNTLRRPIVIFGLPVLLSLGIIGVMYNRRSQSQSRLDDQATAYRAPEIAQPIPVLEEQILAAQSAEPSTRSSHPLDPVLRLAEEIRDYLDSDVVDYTATLVKRERVKGKLGKEEHMEVKIRNRRGDGESRVPLSTYLKFVPPSPNAGREVIWVESRDNGQLHSYQFGIPVKLAPTSALAMMGNKYPITEIGLLRLAEMLIERGKRDRELGICKVEVFEDQMVAGRACQLIQVTHDNRHAQYDFHIAQVYIDNELKVPIRYAAYLWPESAGESPPLEEEYTYSNLKLNVGLKDLDFDPENPEYRFP
jgi:hypothetical protein